MHIKKFKIINQRFCEKLTCIFTPGKDLDFSKNNVVYENQSHVNDVFSLFIIFNHINRYVKAK